MAERRWTYAHQQAALWMCAAIVAGEIGGLIIGGIREVWLWTVTRKKT